MKDFSQKLDHWSRMLLPGGMTLLLFIIFLLPHLGFAGMAYFPPQILMISIYYWTIFHPASMPFWFIFLLGLISDSLFMAPLGITSLTLILFRLLILSQQHFLMKESFWGIWLGFAVSMALTQLLQWAITSAYFLSLLPFGPMAMQWVFTVGLYPLAHLLFNVFYNYLPPPSKHGGSFL